MEAAFVTPWPPQKTGIGDYAFDLISGLRDTDLDISVYTDADKPFTLEGVKVFNLQKNLAKLASHDLLVFQMGNNVDYHLYMLDLIKEHGGVVHLHDMVLHHIMAWITWAQGNGTAYLHLIERWYGEKVRNYVTLLLERNKMPWEMEIVPDIPLFEEVLRYADACIVHSNFAHDKVKKAFPHLTVYKIDQVYKGLTVDTRVYNEKSTFNIGVFGGVDPQKQVDVVINTFAEALKINPNCYLHLVGGVHERCQFIYTLPKSLNITEKVIIHGRVSGAKFTSIFQKMDLCVSLRSPTMGETSAVVMKALQMGIPTIVNNIGWYAELPSFVDKIPTEKMDVNLLEVLKRYVSDIEFYRKKKAEFVTHAEQSLNFDNNINNYRKILGKEYISKLNKPIISKIADMCMTLGVECNNSDPFMKNIVKKLLPIL